MDKRTHLIRHATAAKARHGATPPRCGRQREHAPPPSRIKRVRAGLGGPHPRLTSIPLFMPKASTAPRARASPMPAKPSSIATIQVHPSSHTPRHALAEPPRSSPRGSAPHAHPRSRAARAVPSARTSSTGCSSSSAPRSTGSICSHRPRRCAHLPRSSSSCTTARARSPAARRRQPVPRACCSTLLRAAPRPPVLMSRSSIASPRPPAPMPRPLALSFRPPVPTLQPPSPHLCLHLAQRTHAHPRRLPCTYT
jgi:hypothetical protein